MTSAFEAKVQIDQNRLDDAWLEQPRLYCEYAEKLATAKRDVDLAKSALDVVQADLYRQITAAPELFELSKNTEGAIKAAIAAHADTEAAQREVIDRKYAADILQAAVASLDHRKKALEGLVHLFLADYFSKPKSPKGDGERMAEAEKRAARGRVRGRKKKGHTRKEDE